MLHIIMPVKDSPDTTRQAILALLATGPIHLTVYNDFSTPENTELLRQLALQHQFQLVNWADFTDHPSPNYLLTLQHAQQQALDDHAHLVIVESDVIVRPDTLIRLQQQLSDRVGLVAAVTVDAEGQINFPYLYAKKLTTLHPSLSTKKRLSFCCTLLSLPLLQSCSFSQLDPSRSWYDVAISHLSLKLGFLNILQPDNPVLHLPHSSRPWKQLKYTHPLLYYWQKITRRRDRI